MFPIRKKIYNNLEIPNKNLDRPVVKKPFFQTLSSTFKN